MAVKINNTANLRRAQRWDERDDAALCVLLKRKIKDINVALRESETPYERSRLKQQKRHYKTMLIKVENGAYNGDIIFGELQAASALRSEQTLRSAELATMSGGKQYVSSYQNMDFDYESAFRKKRYYGFSLPLILLILSLAFVFIFIMGAFLPGEIKTVADESGIPLDSLFMCKLSKDAFDIEIKNDGNWPSGVYNENVFTPKEGEPYTDSTGKTPEKIRLCADVGMQAIYISPFDVVKAWFRTPMLKKTRIDFLEDSEYFKGESNYYLFFLDGGKGDALVIRKDADGNYDNSVVMRHIGTYGTIIFLIVTFLLGIVNIIINVFRLFTYTSRRLHVISLLCLILSVLCMLSPAFATMEGTEIGPALSAYFSSLTDINEFLSETSTATVGIGLLFFVPVIINLVMCILPFLFKNVLKKRVTSVPRGNRRRNALNDPLYADEAHLRQMR